MGTLGIWFRRVVWGNSTADEVMTRDLQKERIRHEKELQELEAERRNASEEKKYEFELAIERAKVEHNKIEQELIHQYRLEQAKEQAKLRLDEKNYEFFLQHWPLRTPPILFDKISIHSQIRAIIAPIPNNKGDNYLNNDWMANVTVFLSLYFGANTSHPIEFHDSWREDVPADTGSIYSLFSVLRGTPAIVVCPKIKDGGTKIVFRFAIWLPESAAPQITDLFELPVPQDGQRLIEMEGKTSPQIPGMAAASNSIPNTSADWLQHASVLIAMALGSIADAYYLRENDLLPALPKIAVRLARKIPAAVEWAEPNIAPLYKDLIESCSAEVLCQTTAYLPDRYAKNYDEMLDVIAYFLSQAGLGLSPEDDIRIASVLSWSKAVCAAVVEQMSEDALVSAIRESWKRCGENEFSIEVARKIALVLNGSPGLRLYWMARRPIAIAFEKRTEFVAYSLFTTGFPNAGGEHWLPAKKLCKLLAEDMKEAGAESAIGRLGSHLSFVAKDLNLSCNNEVVKKSVESPLLRDNVILAANMLLRY